MAHPEMPERAHLMRWSLSAIGAIALAVALIVLIPARGQAASSPLSIAVSGNHFVNGSGQSVRLLGVNVPSAEYACQQGWGYDDGAFTDADAAAIAGWHANAVRIPLNEDCWLGINGLPSSSQSGSTLSATGYQQDIEDFVQALNAHGIYAILDLHWSAPGTQMADSQQPMPDAHSTDFWTSVAGTFKADPGVVFDLFNEPFDPTDPKSGGDQNAGHKVSWSCWENGGCTTQSYTQQQGAAGATYTAVGMQALLNAVRGAGATQPVMVGGLDYANDLSQWTQYAPSDPQHQLAASFHNYMGKACDNATCWNSTIAGVAASVPVVTGEFAEDDFAEPQCGVKSDSGFDAAYMDWADQHGVSYLAWGWYVLSSQEQDSAGCSNYVLISDYDGTPASPNGTVLHDHLAALAAGASATTPPPTSTVVSTTTTATASPTSTAASGPASPKPTRPALRRLGVKLLPGGTRVAFKLRSSQTCTGVLSGLTLRSFPRPHRHRARLTLGSVRFSLHAGTAKTVVLRLRSAVDHLLTGRRGLRVTVAVTLTNASHLRSVTRRTLTLARPR